MHVAEKTRREIEARVSQMSDFVKMEYLESCVKSIIDIEARRFCYLKLAELYENKSMFSDAVKYLTKFEELCINISERLRTYVKEAELFIKGGYYDHVDFPFKKALAIASEYEKHEIKRRIISVYREQMEKFEKTGKIAGALKIYEKLVHLLSDAEQVAIKNKMLVAYKKLGKIRESIGLERELARMPRI